MIILPTVAHMSNFDLLTTEQVAAILGITRQAVFDRVRRGALVPVFKSPAKTGGYLFTPDSIDAAPARYQR